MPVDAVDVWSPDDPLRDHAVDRLVVHIEYHLWKHAVFLSRSSFIKLSFIYFLAKYKGNLETTSSSFLGKIHKREATEVRLWHDKREAMKRVITLKSKTDLSWNRWRLASSDRPHSRRGSRWTQRMPDRLCLLVDV